MAFLDAFSPIVAAHAHCTGNRGALGRSAQCGCFFCLEVFAPVEIVEWIDEDTTALQPALRHRLGDSEQRGLPDDAGVPGADAPALVLNGRPVHARPHRDSPAPCRLLLPHPFVSGRPTCGLVEGSVVASRTALRPLGIAGRGGVVPALKGTKWSPDVDLRRERASRANAAGWVDSGHDKRPRHPFRTYRAPRHGLPTPRTAQQDWSESSRRQAQRGARDTCSPSTTPAADAVDGAAGLRRGRADTEHCAERPAVGREHSAQGGGEEIGQSRKPPGVTAGERASGERQGSGGQQPASPARAKCRAGAPPRPATLHSAPR